MVATAATVRGLSLTGEFASYTDEQIGAYLLQATDFIAGIEPGARYDRAQALLAAHLLSMFAAGGSSPAVISERLGPGARTFDKPAALRVHGALGLHATPYGQLYAALFETFTTTPIVVFDGTVPSLREDY